MLTRAPQMPTRLRVNYLDAPLAIDDSAPTFSWELQAPEGARAAQVGAGCSLSVQADDAATTTDQGNEGNEGTAAPSNATTFVPLPAGVTLATDTAYSWTVTCGAHSASSTFSTGLLQPSDWGAATWIGGVAKEAVLMRKAFSVSSAVKRARIFVAVPGYGQVSLNGQDVDGVAGTRTWSQCVPAAMQRHLAAAGLPSAELPPHMPG
jgi:alpha-L-rhamnosidase